MQPIEIKSKLEEQKGFLERSLADYTEGHLAEAVRLSTTIRVLVHETGNSKPLLKMLRSDYLNLPIPDSRGPGPERVILFVGIGLNIRGREIGPVTRLQFTRPSTLGKWWQKICLIFTAGSETIQFTRRELLLTLANKEGGAHVDPVLPLKYENYILKSPLKLMVHGIETDTLHLARYAAVESSVQMLDCLNRIMS